MVHETLNCRVLGIFQPPHPDTYYVLQVQSLACGLLIALHKLNNLHTFGGYFIFFLTQAKCHVAVLMWSKTGGPFKWIFIAKSHMTKSDVKWPERMLESTCVCVSECVQYCVHWTSQILSKAEFKRLCKCVWCLSARKHAHVWWTAISN